MRRVLAAGLVVVALGVSGAIALRLVAPGPGDEEEIRALFHHAAQAIADRRVGEAMERVSATFTGDGLDRRGLHRLLLGHTLRGAWLQVHVAAERVRVEGDGAEAVLLALAARGGTGANVAQLLPSKATALRIACSLAREGGAWRVVAAEWHEIGVEEARGAATVKWFVPRGR